MSTPELDRKPVISAFNRNRVATSTVNDNEVFLAERACHTKVILRYFLFAFLPLFAASEVSAQNNSSPTEKQSFMELYGFIMTDAGYSFNGIDPDYYDLVKPTKLPAYCNQFGSGGTVYFSMRQTRVGIKNNLPTSVGELKTMFEFDLFGTGSNTGQTAFHLRHAYGELGKFGAGQTWSPFMDIDVFGNSLEYSGPPGMAFFRNMQIRYMPIQGDSRVAIALERPGIGVNRCADPENDVPHSIKPSLSLPDLSAEYRYGKKWGYVELAGLLRYLKWKDADGSKPDFSGTAVGWGLNFSSGIKVTGKNLLHLQLLYGKGIENYMNDAPDDIGFKQENGGIKGVPLPVFGTVIFYDHNWNDKLSSCIGYSGINISNSNRQLPSDFKRSDYALVNLLYYPAPNVTIGAEFQYGRRTNFNDGWTSNISKMQFSFKYNFNQKLFGNQP